jgi:hypothetical protein
MSAAAKEVLEAAMKLQPTEREQIAHELLESIDESSDVELSPERPGLDPIRRTG